MERGPARHSRARNQDETLPSQGQKKAGAEGTGTTWSRSTFAKSSKGGAGSTASEALNQLGDERPGTLVPYSRRTDERMQWARRVPRETEDAEEA